MGFVIGSYQALEHPGGGHRAAATRLWRGEDLRSGDEVALTVLPVEFADDARAAVQRMQAISHPHLLAVSDVVTDDMRVALASPWPRAGRLRELLDRRGRLTAGETLTVLIPLVAALAAIHSGGVRHTGVSPETVWFDPHGRPLLGAVAVSRLVADLNDGLPDSSRDVAPEVVRGERAGGRPVTVAADVFSLGSVALQCLTGRSAWPADDPADVLVQSAAGLWPDPPDDAGPAELVELVRAMLSAEPERRPDAPALADRLTRVGSPAPIRFGFGPTPVPASTDRWRGWAASSRTSMSEGAAPPLPPARSADRPDARVEAGSRTAEAGSGSAGAESGTDSPVPGRRLPGPRRAGGGPVSRRRRSGARLAAESRDTEVRPVTRSGEAADIGAGDGDQLPAGRTPVARAGIALLCGLLVTLVAVQLGVWLAGWEDPENSVADGADTVAATDWAGVVGDLDAARAQALAAADPSLLAQVYVADAPAAAADAVTIGRLADQGWRVVGGVHLISSVTPEPHQDDGSGPIADHIRLSVVDTLPAHPVVDATGRQVGLTPARTEQRRLLVVDNTADGYRISDIQPG